MMKQLTIFRRFLLLQLLMLWQGGFLFYALVVVPIGGEVLGSATEQGFITRRVTLWMNAIGAVALLAMSWDALYERLFRRSRLLGGSLAMLILSILILIHGTLDSLLNPIDHTISDRAEFYRWHAAYLTLTGVLWGVMLGVAWLTLASWRAGDAIVECRDTNSEKA